jgi:hypothetical protein
LDCFAFATLQDSVITSRKKIKAKQNNQTAAWIPTEVTALWMLTSLPSTSDSGRRFFNSLTIVRRSISTRLQNEGKERQGLSPPLLLGRSWPDICQLQYSWTVEQKRMLNIQQMMNMVTTTLTDIVACSDKAI